MNKCIKFIVLYVVFIFICLLTAEFFAYKYTIKQKQEHSRYFIVDEQKLQPFYKIEMNEFDEIYKRDKDSFRKPNGINHSKKPIVLFGCSHIYGYRLEDNQTLSYHLSEKSQRPVYNRAYYSWGMPHMVYQLSQEDFYREVPEPEYLIYFFSKHHLQMFYDYVFQLWDNNICLRYKEKNGCLVKVKNPPKMIQGSYLLKAIYRKLAQNSYDCVFSEKDEKLTILHFKTAKQLSQKYWKNTKYVVVFLDETTETEGFDKRIQSDLEKEGFIIVKVKDLLGFSGIPENYRVLEDDPHPSEEYWILFVPKLIKELNL